MGIVRKLTLDELVSLPNPEIYDLKDEKGYEGQNSLEKMKNYKNAANDGFDCDGSLGSNCCVLIREIYRLLWEWEDIDPRGSLKRYAHTCLHDGVLMGPETMNSFMTTYNRAVQCGIEDNDLLCRFSNIVGRIGNMTLTYAGFNRNVYKDYWDLKLERQYLKNNTLSTEAKTKYINMFFQWDYVNCISGEYTFKPFWDGHDENSCLPNQKCEIANYIRLIDQYTKRRGVFIVSMLNISYKKNPDDYKRIQEDIFLSTKTYADYSEVFCDIENIEDLSESTRIILKEARNKIAKYYEA